MGRLLSLGAVVALLLPQSVFIGNTTTATGAATPSSCNVGQLFTTNAGTMSVCTAANTWTALSGGGGTPGGSNTQVQFNDSSAFGGDAGLTYVKATDALTVSGSLGVGQAPITNVIGTFGPGAVDADFLDATVARVVAVTHTDAVGRFYASGTTISDLVLANSSASANLKYAQIKWTSSAVTVNSLNDDATLKSNFLIIGDSAGGGGIPAVSAEKLLIANAGLLSTTYSTATNCADSAGDAACGSAAAGAFVIDAADTNTVVSTTAVTANSEITVTEDSSLGTRLGVTCNSTIARVYQVTARTAGTSFTVTASVAPTTNPACLIYVIVN